MKSVRVVDEQVRIEAVEKILGDESPLVKEAQELFAKAAEQPQET